MTDSTHEERGLRLVDSHLHIDMPAFDADRAEVVERARQAGVERMLLVGCVDAEAGHRRALRVAEEQSAGLIVMGTRGRSRSAAVLLGSETEHVIMESRIPVLAVKRSGTRVKMLQALRDRRLHERGYERFT